MNICVFGSASDEIGKIYIEAVEKLGEGLAVRGHDLVFGAGECGLMGAAARGFKRKGARLIGVVPEYFKENLIETLCLDCDELIYTKTMAQRKQTMINRSDVFVVTPGGMGTFDELFEIITLKQLDMLFKPIILYNINGYYDDMKKMIDTAISQKFIKERARNKYVCIDDGNGVLNYIDKL